MNKQETQLSLTNHATQLCKCNGVADLLNARPSPIPICRIWSFCVKRFRHKFRTQKIGEPENPGTLLSWVERHGWSQSVSDY